MRASEEALPHQQHRYEGLPALDPATLQDRRQRALLFFSGLFLGTLAMLNILGTSRFLDLSFTVPGLGWRVPMPVAVGVLPYPVTFLCTDFVSELWGRRRAGQLVWMGLLLNVWVVAILWLGGLLPGMPGGEVFFAVRRLTFANVTASMLAYLAAQFVDVYLFHFWKRLTRGRHLWLRNNGSTMVSQLVDTVAVILGVHFFAGALPVDPGRPLWPQLLTFIAAGYIFKLLAAAVDTGPFYLGVRWLSRYLRLPPPGERPSWELAASAEASSEAPAGAVAAELAED